MGVYLGRNAVEVYGGGVKVKPEEEKTVTASTSTIEVTPTSGMALKRVIVNPTPSEEKTVIPSASQQTVSPSDGKVLSSVTVEGDANLISENIRKDISIFGVSGILESEGLYIWKKYENVNLISFTVQSDVSDTRYSYSAEEGMTWEQFVASGYNTDNIFSPNAPYVSYGIDSLYRDNTFDRDVRCSLTDEIINGHNYYYYT